jgi:uncharacterized membrane protein YfcA
MEWSLIDIIVICAGIGLGAFVKGAIGFGLPMIATPMMLFAMPLPEVVAVMLAPVLLTNIQQCWLNRQHWRSLFTYWPMMVATIIVLFPGSRLLAVLDSGMLAAIVGAMIFILVVIDNLPRELWMMRQLAKIDGRKFLIPAGMLSGVSGSLTSIYSFPSLQLMVSLRLPKNEFVFVIGVYLLCGYTSIWAGLAVAGFPTPAIALDAIWVLIPGAIGLFAGNNIRNRLSADAFRRLVNIALAIAGISLVVKYFLT